MSLPVEPWKARGTLLEKKSRTLSWKKIQKNPKKISKKSQKSQKSQIPYAFFQSNLPHRWKEQTFDNRTRQLYASLVVSLPVCGVRSLPVEGPFNGIEIECFADVIQAI